MSWKLFRQHCIVLATLAFQKPHASANPLLLEVIKDIELEMEKAKPKKIRLPRHMKPFLETKPKRTRHIWKKSEIAYIKENYPHKLTSELANRLCLPEDKVYKKAQSLGLRKTEEFLRSDASGRLNSRSDKGNRFRFPKGHQPWNKGKKGLQTGGEATQFKPGHKPVNTLIDGAVTVRTDKKGRSYKFIRIQEGVWHLLHAHVWAQANGPIPEGMIVVFRDRDTMNCNLENLELISKAENMRRNQIHHFPEELKSTIRLLSQLKRKLNEKQNRRSA